MCANALVMTGLQGGYELSVGEKGQNCTEHGQKHEGHRPLYKPKERNYSCSILFSRSMLWVTGRSEHLCNTKKGKSVRHRCVIQIFHFFNSNKFCRLHMEPDNQSILCVAVLLSCEHLVWAVFSCDQEGANTPSITITPYQWLVWLKDTIWQHYPHVISASNFH